ncbi:MAG: DUF86 domain-containing protein [Methanomicrobiales archaeon]|nr:DUF86 domain-containing protein [Methanomicrobiales archaeon]
MTSGGIRRDLIFLKLQEINDAVTLIEKHLPPTVGEFIHLGLIKDGIYKRTEFAIEDVFDICAVLNTDLRLGIPSEEEDLIKHLIDAQILSPSIRPKLKGMRGFRNIMVHRYGTIDDRLAFEVLRRNLQDFSAFCDEIRSYLAPTTSYAHR